VVSPGDVPEKSKERDRRTDRVDSRKLVRELSSGSLDLLYIPSEESDNFRILVRYIQWCSRQNIRIKTRIKSVLAYLGITVYEDYPEEASRNWNGNYIKWLEELEFDSGPARDCLQYHIQELREHRNRKASILRRLRKECKGTERMEIIRLLCSIPGIGFQTAVVLLAELIDMKRFSTINKLKAYAGLIPAGEQSSDTRKEKGITKRRNRYLRNILIEASWVALRYDPALFSYYSKLKRRMKGQDAIIRIAKKLLSRIRHVWLHKEPYKKGIK
jgi:transposase